MRVTFVIPYFAPAWAYGGPPRLAYDLGRQLVKADHTVHVLTTDALDGVSRAAPAIETLDGMYVQRLPNVGNALAWKYKLFFPRGFVGAIGAATRTSDVVHLFDFRDYQNAVAYRALRRARIPFVLSAVGELPRASGIKRPVKMVYDLLVGFRMVRKASALIAQTPEEASWYCKLGGQPSQIRILPLAVDLDGLPAPTDHGAFRRRLGVNTSERLVLFLGRIHAYKGLDVLIRAFATIRAHDTSVRLVIAGRDDGFLESARALARQVAPPESVLFAGPIYGADRFQAYRDADVFALTPTHAEQTSLAALEAAACGTPVLVTEQAPIPGLDASGGGLTVRNGVETIAAGLERLLAGDRAAAGERAARLVRDRFALSSIGRELEKLYADVIGQANGA